MLLAFDALLLSQALGRAVSVAKIIHGDSHSTLRVKVTSLLSPVSALTCKMSAMLAGGSPPDLILNRHCGECEFRDGCRQKASEKDDLSLLGGMTEKERKKLHGKGIFTITQLSFTFRPRRRPKRLRNRREKCHLALRALALRQRKTFIVGSPELKIDGTPVYLDVEGRPDRDFYYLIGLREKAAHGIVERSFWAGSAESERKAWRDFLAALADIERPSLFHYGSFETTFMRRMSERYGEPLPGSQAAGAIRTAVNLLSLVFAQVYFPTYSNGLTEVGSWVGFRWSGANPSGMQAIVWRSKWEQSGDPVAKQNLIAYNLEDCRALEVLTECVVRLCSSDARPNLENGTDPAAMLAESSSSQDRLLRRFTTPIGDLEVINKAARWDFQRDRVYIRTDQPLRRAAAKKRTRLAMNKSRRRQKLPVNKRVTCERLLAFFRNSSDYALGTFSHVCSGSGTGWARSHRRGNRVFGKGHGSPKKEERKSRQRLSSCNG
jgi:predicted RecB family nuclease